MARIGLALSGGGSKGAFIVGALKIIDQRLDPQPYPVISGTSTGALIGTPASINESVPPQIAAIDEEPFDSRVSDTIRIV